MTNDSLYSPIVLKKGDKGEKVRKIQGNGWNKTNLYISRKIWDGY